MLNDFAYCKYRTEFDNAVSLLGGEYACKSIL